MWMCALASVDLSKSGTGVGWDFDLAGLLPTCGVLYGSKEVSGGNEW